MRNATHRFTKREFEVDLMPAARQRSATRPMTTRYALKQFPTPPRRASVVALSDDEMALFARRDNTNALVAQAAAGASKRTHGDANVHPISSRKDTITQLMHIIPVATGATGHISSQTFALAKKDPALGEVLRDVDFITEFAMSIFRGVCPTDDPEGIRLGWHNDYQNVSKKGSGAILSEVLNQDVATLVHSLYEECTNANEPPKSWYVNFSHDSEAKLDAQIAALSIVVAFDGMIERLVQGNCADSLLWQAQAFRNWFSLRHDLKAGLHLD